MKTKTSLVALSIALALSVGVVAGADRTVLPIAEPEYPAITEVDARKATPPARFEVKAPEGARTS